MKEHLYLKDEQIKDLVEKLFYAYRETFSDPKKILKRYSYGIAHQKVIQLVERHQGITVSDLLRKLKITKQSLNRVLRDLISKKAIIMKKGEVDSRLRHIFLNENYRQCIDLVNHEVECFYQNCKLYGGKYFYALRDPWGSLVFSLRPY